jgi:4-hydroxybenzoate polyprenyltransferase
MTNPNSQLPALIPNHARRTVISGQSITNRVTAYLQMMRPANIVTAWADILAGYAAAGLVGAGDPNTVYSLFWLLLATTGLYGGGVVFNDVLDAKLDAKERPERPIPSGRSSVQEGVFLGIGLLTIGIMAAAQVSLLSAGIATAIALAALLYDSVGKHHVLIAPLNMGLCRGGNLLLGVSALPIMVQERLYLAAIPILYITAITLISRGEVHGGSRIAGFISLGLLALVCGGLLELSPVSGTGAVSSYDVSLMLPFGVFWAMLVFPAFANATREPSPELIRMAVRSGVIALIALDSAIAAGFSHWIYGLMILSLLPLSRLLAKQFAVT